MDMVGARIRAKRLAAGLSQQQLADAVGMTQASISRIEADKQMLRVSDLYAIARILSTPPLELIGAQDAA